MLPDLEDTHQIEVRLSGANNIITSPEVVPNLKDLHQRKVKLHGADNIAIPKWYLTLRTSIRTWLGSRKPMMPSPAPRWYPTSRISIKRKVRLQEANGITTRPKVVPDLEGFLSKWN